MVHKRAISVLVAAAAMMVASCSGGVESEFVAECTSQGAPEAKCTCLYEKLEAKYGEDSLETMQKGQAMLPGFVEATVVGSAECSGVDPSTALKQLGIQSESPELANKALGKQIAQADPSDALVSTDAAEVTAQRAHVPDDAVIENAIAVTASSEEGDEYKEARKVATGDLNGDNVSDAVALFTVEVASQNTTAQHLSAFLRQDDGSLKFASTTSVGGSGNAINEVAIDGGAVTLKALTLGPDDPDCCPSVEEKVEYLVRNGKLKRVN
jgi:hypothetical protein